jgi:hypothetical protein
MLSPRLGFLGLTLAAWLALALSVRTRAALGIAGGDRWFLDSAAVLAASDAHRAGIPPDAPNPYDVFHRSHKYSDAWFALGAVGLTRADNFLVGGIWVLAFFGALAATLRPRTPGEAAWLALLAASPPVMLGVVRANNDLVIFALLAVALCAGRRATPVRTLVASAAVALAAGLKFYPVVAAAVFLVELRTRAERVRAAIGVAAALGALALVAGQVSRGMFPIEPEIQTFGARIWMMSLGLSGGVATLTACALFAAAVAFWWRSGALPETEPAATDDATRALVLGAAVLAACFVAGVSFGYRLIFVLWLAPWIWSRRETDGLARGAVWLLPLLLWRDGLLALATELFFPGLTPAAYARILRGWWIATEPVTWLFVTALAAWLARRIWREFSVAVTNARPVSS